MRIIKDSCTSLNLMWHAYQRALTSFASTTNTWDYKNRLTVVAASSTPTTYYAYDHTTQRIAKGDGTATTTYPTKYWNIASATTTRHIFTPSGELVATIEGNGTATSTKYVHTDHLGGTNVVTNSLGEYTEVSDYYPYGTDRISLGSYDDQRKVTGHEYDTPTD